MRIAALLVFLIGCPGSGTDKDSGNSNTDDSCEACLADGGTWQVSECTEDCALQDASCFTDECPGECGGGEDCGNCFSQTDCEAQECTWNVEAEAAWCTA